MVQFKLFPYQVIDSARTFIQGHPSDKRSLVRRIRAEFFFDPLAFAVKPTASPLKLPLQAVDVSDYSGPNLQDLGKRKFYSSDNSDALYLIYGSFAFEEANAHWGILLVSDEGKVLRAWPISHDNPPTIAPHIGMAISDSGDLATNTNGILASYSWCGDKNWEAHAAGADGRSNNEAPEDEDFHHDISYSNGKYYTFYGPRIVSIDSQSGAIIDSIHAADLVKWARDQNLALFDARFKRFYRPAELGERNWENLTFPDPLHMNKVEVLSKALAPDFEGLEEGDMLVSMRNLNLVFVVRPRSKEILWYRYGLSSRQHDATFQRGYISVFNNNPFASSGRSPGVLGLSVSDHTSTTLFDLKQWGLEMPGRGNFELDDNSGFLLVSDDDNGRIIAGDLSGAVHFIFENRIDGKTSLQLRNASRISRDQYLRWNLLCD